MPEDKYKDPLRLAFNEVFGKSLEDILTRMNPLLLQALREYLMSNDMTELEYCRVWLKDKDFKKFEKLIQEYIEIKSG